MAKRRKIDERDIDQLLAALSDRQIADLFGMTLEEVSQLRKSRQANQGRCKPVNITNNTTES